MCLSSSIVRKNRKAEKLANSVLTIDQVKKIKKKHLREFIISNREFVDEKLTLEGRGCYTPTGFFDLLFTNKDEHSVYVKLLMGKIRKNNLNRLLEELAWTLRHASAAKIVLVCKDISAKAMKELVRQKNIEVLSYGWKMHVYPKKYCQ